MMIDSSESIDGSDGAGGGAVEGTSRKQRIELARRKVANAAYSARNVVVGVLALAAGDHDEDNSDVTPTVSNTAASVSAAGVSSSSPSPPPTTTTDEINAMNMTNNYCILQVERSSNSRDQLNRIENSRQSNIIMLVSSMAVLGLAVVLQQQSPTSAFTAVFYFVLGYCADKIRMHSFTFDHQRSTQHRRDIIFVDAGTQTLPSPSLSSEPNTHNKIIGSTAHYLEKTKQLLSQHNLLAVGGQNMNVRRYSNLLHSSSVVSVMATERTNRRRVTYDDKDDIIGEEEDAAIREWKRRRRAPFSEGPLMDHLLNYSDFHRLVKKSTKSTMNVMAKVVRASSARNESKSTEDDDMHWDEEEEEEEEKEEDTGGEVGDTTTSGTISVGKAKLNNVRASRVFTHVVDPLCCLRGMDLFVTDTPEEEIWRQPMLNE